MSGAKEPTGPAWIDDSTQFFDRVVLLLARSEVPYLGEPKTFAIRFQCSDRDNLRCRDVSSAGSLRSVIAAAGPSPSEKPPISQGLFADPRAKDDSLRDGDFW